MYDKIEKIGQSLIQHGKANDRIYLMKLSDSDFPHIIESLDNISKLQNYSKIFAKVHEYHIEEFLNNDYMIEAQIPKFYYGKEDGFFICKYLDSERRRLSFEDLEDIRRNIQIANAKKGSKQKVILPDKFKAITLNKEFAQELSELYRIVFPSYPFPIHEPEFIAKTMEENVEYFGIIDQSNNKLAAASSSEKYADLKNAEMTDFATDPDYLGNALALHLLDSMEDAMKKQNYKNLYTIARSHSTGMNVTFAKNNYNFAGTLINNTNISGRIESMNVWYKLL